jgi:hypothetical protein
MDVLLLKTGQVVESTTGGRRGSTLVELLVGFLLIVTTLGVSAPLVVRHERLLIDADHYRIALDELTNQLGRLRATPAAQIDAALQQLKPSELTAQRLAGAKLAGNVESGDSGRRVKLQLSWDEPQRRTLPVELVAWLSAENAEESESGAARRQP